MALTTDDYADVGLLIGFALQPVQRPRRAPEYRRTLNRYRTEAPIRDAVDGVLSGLGARALSDELDTGLILGIEEESPFAFRLGDFRLPNTQTRNNRLIAGLVLVGMAAYAYPTPADLDEDRPRHVNAVDFEQWMRQACDRLKSADASGEVIPDEGLDAAWRVYAAMPNVVVGDKGRGSNRLSPKCTAYWIRNVAGWMTEQGLARDTSDTDSHGVAAWTLTTRFRVQVREMAAEPAYTALAALRNADDTDHPTPAGDGSAGDGSAAVDGEDADDSVDGAGEGER